MKIFVGTSGYGYNEWKGKFYPEKISPQEMLRFYAERLNAVEINTANQIGAAAGHGAAYGVPPAPGHFWLSSWQLSPTPGLGKFYQPGATG